MTEEQAITSSSSLPFFLRVAAILIIVAGTLGMLFYLFVAIYQLTDRNFLYEMRYKGFSGLQYHLVLFAQLLLNAGLVMSAILLLKLKRAGLYVFAISYLVFGLLSYLLQDEYGWTIPIIGFILLIIIALHYKKLT
jgi:hypothetical protein